MGHGPAMHVNCYAALALICTGEAKCPLEWSVNLECWDGECVMGITLKLDNPNQAGGSPYMYVQINTSSIHVGEHVAKGQLLVYSGSFIEICLTPDWAYGVSNYRWGVDILTVFPGL